MGVAIFALRRHRDAVSVRAELARLSLRDNLTGLPNRLYLSEWLPEELARVQRTHAQLTVLFIDLDRFRAINDTYGHDVGDALMVAVARRLRSLADDDDRVVRYGGDEFILVSHTIGDARGLASRVADALASPFTIGTDVMRLSASVGAATSDRRTDDADGLIRAADIAMFEARDQVASRVAVFDHGLHGDLLSPKATATRLQEALDQGHFRLVYQPIVEVTSGTMSGVECLLRWDDPQRGPIAPDEFISVLEESGLIVPVGAWVLAEACAQARRWADARPDRAPLRVSVNVSARQLGQVDFDRFVAATIASSGLDPRQLCLEITEGALVSDVTEAWTMLRRIKRMGVSLALDDFGTGYSSLSHVRRFQLDLLKIDKTFVDGLGSSFEDSAIVEHLIGMAHGLGMTPVAEGVETAVQLAELRRLGCDLVQGYLVGRPTRTAAIDQMLQGEVHGSRGRSGPEADQDPTSMGIAAPPFLADS